jgi:hypothetical protein
MSFIRKKFSVWTAANTPVEVVASNMEHAAKAFAEMYYNESEFAKQIITRKKLMIRVRPIKSKNVYKFEISAHPYVTYTATPSGKA